MKENKMKKILFLVLGLCFFIPSGAMAQYVDIEIEVPEINLTPLEEVDLEPPRMSTGSNGERQTYLQLEQPAPWDGVLLNPAAVAFIVAEYQALYQRALLAIQRQRQSDWLRLQLEVGRLQSRISAMEQVHRIELEGRDREILRQQANQQALINSQNNNLLDQMLLVGAGALGGLLVGVLVGVFAGN